MMHRSNGFSCVQLQSRRYVDMKYKVDIRKAFQWGSDCLKKSRERGKEMKRCGECM